MEKKDYIKNKIIAHFPNEITIVGTDTLETLVELQVSGQDPEIFSPDEGKNLGVEAIISIVGTLVGATDLTIKLIEYLKKRKEKINKANLLEEVKKKSAIETFDYDIFLKEIIEDHAKE